jgi:hypothetical protein
MVQVLHVCLEANRGGGHEVMAMGSMDAKVVAHFFAGNDVQQGRDMFGVVALELGVVCEVGKGIVPATKSVQGVEVSKDGSVGPTRGRRPPC